MSSNTVRYPGDDLKTGAKELLNTGLYSDVTIKCGNKEFKVHRNILHMQSKYFAKLFSSGFKESTQNSNSSVIELKEVDPKIFQAVIHYLYNFKWDDSAHGTVHPAVFAVQVYQLADIYEVEPLRTLAASRFQSACDPNDTLHFIEAIRAVDERTAPLDHKLWDIILPLIKKHISLLLQCSEFKALIKAKDDLTWMLLGELNLDNTSSSNFDSTDGVREWVTDYNYSSPSFGSGRRLG